MYFKKKIRTRNNVKRQTKRGVPKTEAFRLNYITNVKSHLILQSRVDFIFVWFYLQLHRAIFHWFAWIVVLLCSLKLQLSCLFFYIILIDLEQTLYTNTTVTTTTTNTGLRGARKYLFMWHDIELCFPQTLIWSIMVFYRIETV